MTPKRTFRYYYLRFTRLRGEPKALARGTAIGTFLGVLPSIPFHTVTVLIVTFITRTSTIAALLATLIVCNPLTYIPQYYLSLLIGNFLTPYTISWERIKTVLDVILHESGFMVRLDILASLGYEVIIVLLVGGIVLAIPFTIGSYFLSLRFFIRINEHRRKKHILS